MVGIHRCWDVVKAGFCIALEAAQFKVEKCGKLGLKLTGACFEHEKNPLFEVEDVALPESPLPRRQPIWPPGVLIRVYYTHMVFSARILSQGTYST